MLAILCYTCMLPKYTFLNQTVQSRYESNVILVKFSLISEIVMLFSYVKQICFCMGGFDIDIQILDINDRPKSQDTPIKYAL